jgi:hypothetical protein
MMQAEAVGTVDDLGAWEMFAAGDEEGSPNPLRHFGPLGYSRQDGSAMRVLRVLLVETDQPDDGDYWAWLDYGATQPSCIAATEEAMTRRFKIGEDVPGPRENEALEMGRILRLRVTVIEEMFMRAATRRSWQISSAL